MNVREKIEQSGTDHRWEFDRKRLFEQSNYMARICENLSEVATVLDQFHKFLGPELKSVTGDSAGIDEVMARVESLVIPFEASKFDIFERLHKSNWDAVMEKFRGTHNLAQEHCLHPRRHITTIVLSLDNLCLFRIFFFFLHQPCRRARA
jgi:hypothetical protein